MKAKAALRDLSELLEFLVHKTDNCSILVSAIFSQNLSASTRILTTE